MSRPRWLASRRVPSGRGFPGSTPPPPADRWPASLSFLAAMLTGMRSLTSSRCISRMQAACAGYDVEDNAPFAARVSVRAVAERRRGGHKATVLYADTGAFA